MRIVARCAFNIPVDQLHRSRGIGSFSAGHQRGHQVPVVLQRQRQAEWVRRLHIAAEHIRRVHRPMCRHLSIGNRGAHGHGPIVATQALVARPTKQRLHCGILRRVAGVSRVSLRRELLVPEPGTHAGVRRMTISAWIRPRTADRRRTPRPQAVNSQRVPADLAPHQCGSRQPHHQSNQQRPEPHVIAPRQDSSIQHTETPAPAG